MSFYAERNGRRDTGRNTSQSYQQARASIESASFLEVEPLNRSYLNGERVTPVNHHYSSQYDNYLSEIQQVEEPKSENDDKCHWFQICFINLILLSILVLLILFFYDEIETKVKQKLHL